MDSTKKHTAMSTITFHPIHAGKIWNNINPNVILRMLTVIVLLTVLFACNLLQSPEMKFDVNDNLLGLHEKNPVLNINYQVPVGYAKLSEASLPELHHNIPGQDKESTTICAIYKDALTGSWMIISRVNEGKWEQYSDFVDNTPASPLALEWNYVNATTFTYNKFDVQQWLLQDFEWVNFKLLFNRDNAFFQVDYFIPTLKYDREVASVIESSIGSFASN